MAITAWSQTSDQFDLLMRKWVNLIPPKRDDANRLAVAHQRHAKHGAQAADARICLGGVARDRSGNRECARLGPSNATRPTMLSRPVAGGRHSVRYWRYSLGCSRKSAAERNVTFRTPDGRRTYRPAQACASRAIASQHRQQFGRRPRDDLEHVAGRSLVFKVSCSSACSPARPRTAACSRWRSRPGRRRSSAARSGCR